MAQVRDSFIDLERRRLLLEENVSKLQASLRHWQAWEIEYEGIKEELSSLGENYNQMDLEKIVQESEDNLFGNSERVSFNQKDRTQLLKDDKGRLRDKKKVIDLLARRIDYVQENVKTIVSQLSTAGEKLAAATVLSNPEVCTEEGLPLKEIHEELDEEGNVISSSISEPNQTAPQITEALRKAGVRSLEEDESEDSPKANNTDLPLSKGKFNSSERSKLGKDCVHQDDASPEESKAVQTKNNSKPAKLKKSVNFAEDTKPESYSTNGPASRRTPPEEGRKVKESSNIGFDPLWKVNVSEDTDQVLSTNISSPEIPNDEPPEDAALRRQMLQYNMNEVGAVVAELDLDDDGFVSDGSEIDVDCDDNEEEEEDDFGRSSTPVLSEDYVAQMQKLEKQLHARAMLNVGPDYDAQAATDGENGAQKTANAALPNGDHLETKIETAARKGVWFASELDAQEAPLANITNTASLSKPATQASTWQNTVIERTASALSSTDHSSPKKTPSRFKASRSQETQIRTDGSQPAKGHATASSQESVTADLAEQANSLPEQRKLHAATVIERPSSSSTAASSKLGAPDEFDSALLNQQVSTEYHRMRNRMIQREGGFLAQKEEDGESPPAEVDENGRKMSRFKAARLGRR